MLGAPQAGGAVYGGQTAFRSARIPGKFGPPGPGSFGAKPSRGKFLVASRKIKDPRFMETVILLTQYGPRGASGLVINRPTEVELSEMFPDIEGLTRNAHSLYYGGPVAMDRVQLLIRSDAPPEEALPVFDGVYFGLSRALLERVSNGGVGFRAYAGYSGWAAGQLEMELKRDDWHVMRADVGTVFEADPSTVWPELIRRTEVYHVKARDRQEETSRAFGENRARQLADSGPKGERDPDGT
jgi:putative transcriptional regulator